jgi:hypothetical protein
MKHKKKVTNFAFLLLGLGGLQAQEIPTASGGQATGPGGTVSNSVGQIVYSTHTGTNGSVAQGIQQAYEISTILGINETSINLEINVYPNPTSDYLTLKVEITENLYYQLSDMQGKVIENKKITENSTTIKMEGLPTATYFIKVTNSKQAIKTFRIIKN